MTESRRRVLLVDDDRMSRESTQEFLEGEGFDVITAHHGTEALQHLTTGVAVIVTDLVMPGLDGLELLRIARDQAAHAPVIMLTGQGDEKAAVAALKSGAFHYLTKPANPNELANLVRQAVEKFRMATEIAQLHRQLQEKYGISNIIGTSEPMRRVFERIKMVADSRSTVLIEGETGTGKELVARALHQNSARCRKPFIAINCAALPDSLVESELFGHEKGAFTGAFERRIGKFQAADGGTLFVDEIGDMPLELQSKLLRVIESRQVTPLGGNRETSVDVRLVAATNRELNELVRERKFREDLYYRLNVVSIKLPALRERREDVPLLVRHFIGQLSVENDRAVKDVSLEALARLQGYDWPGNVRQLRNVLEGIIVTCAHEQIELEDLPDPIRAAPAKRLSHPNVRADATLEELERDAIEAALQRTAGNRSQASDQLGISVRTLQRKIKEYQLDHSHFHPG